MGKEHQFYLDNEGKEVDFSEKRLKFWLETVPADIRRFEYELWKRYCIIHLINTHELRYKKRLGRFKIKPEFTDDKGRVLENVSR